ncbi:hypothetical protein Glove_91g118 [Diversispora epigaea]|uniref:CCHC-type domain-containing protein n=1 Tax=Diversispora epigaea TaxID=1348612 RepID=A0A397JF24_9GLOM|nr:hypothetical protein Glove_91g121 [Diversispora epigaea]RHZ83563.1 hypothetical protein Glove_91g118 [Diversispora epigaea]
METELDILTRQMQQISLNYATLTSALAAQETPRAQNLPRVQNPRNNNYNSSSYNNNNRFFNNNNRNNEVQRCYNCNEPGHIARDCLSERNQEFEDGEDEYYDDNEFEVYEAVHNKPRPRTRAYPLRSQKQKQPLQEEEVIYQSPSFNDDSMEAEPSTSRIPEQTNTPEKKPRTK